VSVKSAAYVVPVNTNNARYRTSTENFLFDSARSPRRVEQQLVESWRRRRLYLVSVQNHRIQNFLHESAIFILLISHAFLSVFPIAAVISKFACQTQAIDFTTKEEDHSTSIVHLAKPTRLKWTFQ